MPPIASHAHRPMTSLIDQLNRFADAGIDPAFDSECEELERLFAEIRLTDRHF